MAKKTILIGTDAIKKQATLIRDIAQKAIDACDNWPEPMDAHARNNIIGGSLAQQAVVLAVIISGAEFTPETDENDDDED